MSLTIPPGLERWRLVLGEAAENSCGQLSAAALAADQAISWLYDRDPELAARGERRAGLGPSALSTPDWINQIHQLFPKEVIERLEQDAVERYGIHDIVTNLEVLERVKPSESLLKAVLHTRHLMNPEVLAAARKLVAAVVAQILARLQTEIRQAFSGTRQRQKRSRVQIAANFDFKRTVKANLHRYDVASQRLYLERPQFISRSQRHSDPWQIILLIDQSGSMVDSVIHSAVMASCLWAIPGMRTHLVAFDTAVVDLTQDVVDPVELLMKVQLGGGTDIAKAVAYAQGLIQAPQRSVVVLVSDFYEGGYSGDLVRRVKSLCEAGTKFLGLAALDSQADPVYDHEMAARLVHAGAQVGAMTPGQLASWLAEKLQS